MSVAVTVHGELFLIHILHEVLGSKTEWNSTLYMCRVTAVRKCLGQIVAIYCCEFWTDCPRFSNKLEDLATKWSPQAFTTTTNGSTWWLQFFSESLIDLQGECVYLAGLNYAFGMMTGSTNKGSVQVQVHWFGPHHPVQLELPCWGIS